MEDLIVLGGSLLFVLLVVWFARRLYFNRPFSFEPEGAIYTRHGDGRFSTESGVTVADPELLRRLVEEWRVVSNADLAARAGRRAWPGYARDRAHRSGFERGVESVGRFLDRF
jgi:hypothetical protein